MNAGHIPADGINAIFEINSSVVREDGYFEGGHSVDILMFLPLEQGGDGSKKSCQTKGDCMGRHTLMVMR
jgi:hypothetical protein